MFGATCQAQEFSNQFLNKQYVQEEKEAEKEKKVQRAEEEQRFYDYAFQMAEYVVLLVLRPFMIFLQPCLGCCIRFFQEDAIPRRYSWRRQSDS